MTCEYDSASDPGDRRKFRASAREYDALLQQQAILEDLCSAIRLDTADEVLQRIREGASPLDIAELLNSAVRNSNPDNVGYFATSSGDDPGASVDQVPNMNQLSSVMDNWYQTTWYNDSEQMLPTSPLSENAHNALPLFQYGAPHGQMADGQQQPAPDQMHSMWNPFLQVPEESRELSLIRRESEINVGSGAVDKSQSHDIPLQIAAR